MKPMNIEHEQTNMNKEWTTKLHERSNMNRTQGQNTGTQARTTDIMNKHHEQTSWTNIMNQTSWTQTSWTNNMNTQHKQTHNTNRTNTQTYEHNTNHKHDTTQTTQHTNHTHTQTCGPTHPTQIVGRWTMVRRRRRCLQSLELLLLLTHALLVFALLRCWVAPGPSVDRCHRHLVQCHLEGRCGRPDEKLVSLRGVHEVVDWEALLMLLHSANVLVYVVMSDLVERGMCRVVQ